MRRQMATQPELGSTQTEMRDPAAGERMVPKDARRQAAALLATRSVMLALVAASPLALWPAAARALTPHEALELLGKNAFFDTSLSTPGNKQGCVSCHEPKKGGIFPDAAVNKKTVAAPGAAPHRSGSLKPPSNIYALQPTFQPAAGFGSGLPGWGGGTFWNGRAEGCGAIPGATAASCPVPPPGLLGPAISETVFPADLPASRRGGPNDFVPDLGPLADQALNPFPKGVEQNAGEKKVCQQVKTAKYKELYDQAYGEPIDCRDPAVHTSFKRIAVALAAWQRSKDLNRWDSKRDRALAADAEHDFPFDDNDGGIQFTDQENRGHDIFYGKAQCASCHNGFPDRLGTSDTDGTNPLQLYADHRYHNIGVPFNREIPGVTETEKKGLVEHVVGSLPPPPRAGAVAPGFFKTPTLRNVAKGPNGFTKAYAHNGWFKSLKSIVHFYNTRDVLTKCEDPPISINQATEKEALAHNCWPLAEFEANKRVGAIGALGLKFYPGGGANSPEEDEEAAIVAYLETLDDLTTPSPP